MYLFEIPEHSRVSTYSSHDTAAGSSSFYTSISSSSTGTDSVSKPTAEAYSTTIQTVDKLVQDNTDTIDSAAETSTSNISDNLNPQKSSSDKLNSQNNFSGPIVAEKGDNSASDTSIAKESNLFSDIDTASIEKNKLLEKDGSQVNRGVKR